MIQQDALCVYLKTSQEKSIIIKALVSLLNKLCFHRLWESFYSVYSICICRVTGKQSERGADVTSVCFCFMPLEHQPTEVEIYSGCCLRILCIWEKALRLWGSQKLVISTVKAIFLLRSKTVPETCVNDAVSLLQMQNVTTLSNILCYFLAKGERYELYVYSSVNRNRLFCIQGIDQN